MIKKISLVIFFIIISIFIITTPTFAKTMTQEELGDYIDMQNPNANYVWIIGKYVFDSTYNGGKGLDTRDIMLAARSIEVDSDDGEPNQTEIYNKMRIIRLEKKISEDWQSHTWEFGKNYVGSGEQPESYDISYIGHEKVKEIVDTDKLLEEAQSKIQKNEFYGATFENRTLIYNIYDKNKKNSEIKDTGLVGTIRDILKNENVKLLTISYNNINYDFDSAEMKDEQESKAYNKLKELLAKVAGKENFEQVIQGDLVGKELTLTIKLDENIACSQNNKTEESYTIKFIYNAEASIGTEIPEEDKNNLQNSFNYTLENTYQIEGKDDSYKVTGNVKEQENVTGFGEHPSGFYFAYTITLNEGVDLTKVTVKIPKEDNADAGYNVATKDDFTGNQLTVLMEVKENESVKYRDIIIEIDGVPTKIRIDFNELTFLHVHKVSFKGITAYTLTVWDGDKITEDMFPKNVEPSDNYHEFAYWDNGDGTKFSEKTVTKDSGNIDIAAHWNIYSDKFISDVLQDLNKTEDSKSQDFSKEFVIEDYEENSGAVTITVIDPTTKLSRMNDTSIPGAIAYILLKDEIQEITLSVNGEEKTFTKNDGENQETLKAAVQEGAKDLYASIITEQFGGDKTDETVTLNDLTNNENCNSFTLKFNPEKVAKTVTLTKAPVENGISLASDLDVPTEYKFTFESDLSEVKNQSELENALNSTEVGTIYIGQDFSVDKSIEISRNVFINGGSHTLTSSENESVFTVGKSDKTINVTINNLKLKSQNNEGIIVKNAATLTAKEVDVSECKEAGFTVEVGGTFIGSQLTRTSEKYNNPLVKAHKKSGNKQAIVNVIDSEGNEATATTIETVEKYNKEEQQQGNAIGDKKQEKLGYDYVHYFNQSDIAKRWVKIVYIGDRAITHYPITFTRYYDREGTQTSSDIEPPENINYLTTYSNSLATFTVANWMDGITKYEKGNVPAPNSDTYYSAELVAKYNETTKEVKNEDELKEAVKVDSAYKVVIIKNEITLTNVLDIQKEGLMITGAEAGTTEIKGTIKGEIKVTANKVTFDHINIIGKKTVDETQDKPNVVTINGDNFYSNGVKYSAESLGEDNKYWNSILHYNGNDPTTIVYFGNFTGTNVEKMIEFVSEIDENTRIIGNNFEGANETQEFILIDKLKENAKVEIRQQTATFVGENEYGIRVEAPATATTATISLGEFWKKNTDKDVLKIAIDVTETEYDTSGYTFEAGNAFKDKIEIVYVKDGTESNTNPKGEEYNAKLKIGGVLVENPTVPEAATIKGLKLNGDTYSGIINQSENGKFYLPVTLTSNHFKDKVSTVKVTNPNGEESTYTYSSSSNNGIATVSNANTMELQLEAIKSSKITGNNGKVYKIELDTDGKELNDEEVKEYIINYSEVQTLEEKINTAAQNTLEATSLTVEKNNHINGYSEKFAYQYNTEDGLTYLKSDKDNVEEYTFSVKYAGVTDGSSKLSVVARKKIADEEDSGVYLNDWVYVHPLKTGRAIQEVTMLTDVMKDSKTSINAIDTVKLVKGKKHNYTVKLNGDKYTDWVKNNYLLTSKYTITQWGETVLVDVELDENDQYIKSIKTHQESSSNTFDVTFTDVNSTKIKEPTEFLAAQGKELKDEDIKKFYEDGRKWWEKHIYENAYKQ